MRCSKKLVQWIFGRERYRSADLSNGTLKYPEVEKWHFPLIRPAYATDLNLTQLMSAEIIQNNIRAMCLTHQSLRTALTGVESSGVTQFRGIPYGYIPRRFAAAEKIDKYPVELDSTAFG